MSDPLLVELHKRTFRFFWETTNAANGLARDRFPSPSPSSIAAVGFALTAYPIGIERGFVSRQEARSRVLTTLQFLHDAPQGAAARGTSGYRGFFYHFLNMRDGERDGRCELSTVDTALLLAGVLFCQSYFDGDHPGEEKIRSLAEAIYGRVDWQWAQAHAPAISHGWLPETGFLPYDWKGYNEAMIVYLLALGSPTYPVEGSAWDAWTSSYDRYWSSSFGEPHLAFAPLFGHVFSHVWVDFRAIRDPYMDGRGIDYFENSRRAVHAQRDYAVANPDGWKDYGANVWGWTAVDGPADIEYEVAGKLRAFRRYAARGAAGAEAYDDGTLAPSAAVSAIAFAPEIAKPAIEELHRRYGEHIFSRYGFVDALNPSFDCDVPLALGHCVPGLGWVDTDYLGIDQGPILAMLENYQSELVWGTMRKNAHLRRGLTRAGFSGGWLADAA